MANKVNKKFLIVCKKLCYLSGKKATVLAQWQGCHCAIKSSVNVPMLGCCDCGCYTNEGGALSEHIEPFAESQSSL